MDIWEWINDATEELREQGQGRLADLVDDISTACCDGEHERVESIVPEALALARAAKSSWLEVFVRHWLLQSRVLHRHDVSRDTLAEAVSLIELTGRPENRDCPQSVCAVQDLCSAYGLVDGTGYAAQRLAVTAEALARIDPSWPCFDCVSAERASALLDAGRHLEALEFVDGQLAQRPGSTTGLSCTRFRALSALGRNPEAAQVAEEIDLEAAGASGENKKALFQSLAAARQGDRERALELLPAFTALEPDHYVDWLRSIREIGTGDGALNSWHLERAIAEMQRVLTGYESHFTLAKVHKLGSDLALQRGARFSARRHIEAARETATRLVDPGWLNAKLERLTQQLAALPALEPAASVEELQERVGADPEQDLELLRCSGLSQPSLAWAEAKALRALGAEEQAQQVLERASERWPEDEDLRQHLLWLLAQSAAARDDAAEAQRHCRELLERNAEHHDARSLLAKLLREAGELEESLEHLNRLVAVHEPGNLDWDRMLVATLAGRWQEVRDSAARLKLPVEPGEGPIDDRWGACRIRMRLADGRERAYFAWRTGPVTALVDEVVEPDEEQHHGDRIVFEAEPLNREELAEFEASSEAERQRRPLVEYGAFKVLEPGRYSAFELDGFRPEEEALAQLKQELEALGVVWEQRSGEQYRLQDDGQSQPAIFAFLGLPSTCEPESAHQTLSRVTTTLGLRLVWQRLAATAGDDEAVARQSDQADAWGIE